MPVLHYFYERCLTLIWLPLVLCALHEPNYNSEAVIVVNIIYLNTCSVLFSNCFRLGFTNIYSIEE